jgi:hypothetical protein
MNTISGFCYFISEAYFVIFGLPILNPMPNFNRPTVPGNNL